MGRFFCLSFVILFLFSKAGFSEESLPPFLADPAEIDPSFPPKLVEFGIKSNGSTMYAIAYLANGPGPHPTAVLLHGIPGNEKNLDLGQAIRRVGWNIIYFHYRGAWGSEGNYSFTNLLEDVSSVVSFLVNPEATGAFNLRADPDRLVLIGHSLGGFAALFSTANNENVKCAAAMAPADLGKIAKKMEQQPEFVEFYRSYFEKSKPLAGFSGQIGVDQINQNKEIFSVPNYAPKFSNRPVLVVVPGNDTVVPADDQKEMAQKLKAFKPDLMIFEIKGADHPFSGQRTELAKVVTDWLTQICLPSMR